MKYGSELLLEPAPQGHVGASALRAVACEYERGVKSVAESYAEVTRQLFCGFWTSEIFRILKSENYTILLLEARGRVFRTRFRMPNHARDTPTTAEDQF